MLERANEIPRGTTLRTGVCIVGAGAAGITLARELSKTDHDVVLLESGTFEFTDQTQDLYGGTVTGIPYDTRASRLRFFGGSTNHWAGQCRPFDPADFAERDWVPDSGWPFGRNELLSYYERAQKIVDLGPFEYDVDYWLKRMDDVETLLDTSKVRTALYQIGPATHFGTKYRDALVQASNVTIVLGGNAVNVRLDGKRVAGVDVKTLDGNEFAIDAQIVVLGLGGIENARLLLASRTQQPTGVGNSRDLVGRYFMDHSLCAFATLLLSDSAPNPALHFFIGVPMKKAGIPDLEGQPQRQLFGQLVLTPRAARQAGVPSFAAMLSGLRVGQDTPGLGGRDVASLIGDVEGRTGVPRPELKMVTIDGDDRSSTDQFELQINMEPTPYAESRVLLGTDVDELGVPRVDLRWAFHPDDYPAMVRGATVMAHEIGRLGLGRVHFQAPELFPVKYGNHHMGTTRMHKSPKHGVVDEHGEVHDVKNLYVAGSSVFPSVGFSNPTLTITAMALRMADRLQKVLA